MVNSTRYLKSKSSGELADAHDGTANGLADPSSAAHALFSGAPHIERVDYLVRTIAAQQRMQSVVIDESDEPTEFICIANYR